MNMQTQEFLERCILKHNHSYLWKPEASINLEISSMSGLIPKLKGATKYFNKPLKVEVFPYNQKVLFRGNHDWGEVEYSKGNVIFKKDNSQNSFNHRKNFNGINKLRLWSLQDTFYFFGYALITYYSVPSIIKDLELVSELTCGELKGFKVKFPEVFDTHCPVQSFFFDKSGLLVRHDYTAEIISKFSSGSHFTTNYIEKSGVLVAKTRIVKMRLGNWVTPLSVLKAHIK